MSPAQARDFVVRVEAVTGLKPVVYTSGNFTNPLSVPTEVSACPLWYVAIHTFPHAWAKWVFKQNRSGALRGDEFFGVKAALEALVQGAGDVGPDEGTTDVESVLSRLASEVGLNDPSDLKMALLELMGVHDVLVDRPRPPTNEARRRGFDFGRAAGG
jgi:hypothetical protein